MICEVCKEAGRIARERGEDITVEAVRELHKDCLGGTHCDCQHRPAIMQPNGSLAQRR